MYLFEFKMSIDIPRTIREKDKFSLDTIVDLLTSAPFICVSVPADENPNGYEAIRLYVRPQEARMKNPMQAATEEDTPENTRVILPLLAATWHVSQVLQQVADKGTYSANVNRNNSRGCAEGDIFLSRDGIKFVVHYTEDARGVLDSGYAEINGDRVTLSAGRISELSDAPFKGEIQISRGDFANLSNGNMLYRLRTSLAFQLFRNDVVAIYGRIMNFFKHRD